jgi:hypothetical protein
LKNPNLLATASFDGKIAIQTLQNTGATADQTKAAAQVPEGEDFFSQTHVEPQGASFSLKTPPKWLKRRAGVAFGFGGKLVRFGVSDSKSKISISTFAVDSAISDASEEFDKALQEGDLTAICESKIAKAATEEEKADWTVIETLTSENPRSKLVEYLGFAEKGQEEPVEEKKEEEEVEEVEECEITNIDLDEKDKSVKSLQVSVEMREKISRVRNVLLALNSQFLPIHPVTIQLTYDVSLPFSVKDILSPDIINTITAPAREKRDF